VTAEKMLAYLAVAGAAMTVLGGGGLLGWWWRNQPKREQERARNAAMADAILGEPAVLDRSSNEIQPPRPGLVHRVGTVEDAIVEFRHAIGVYTEVLGRLDRVEQDVASLKDARVQHIVSAAERAATAAASAEMLRLAAERDTIRGDVDDDTD
jgi:alpha-D-ribose 1-methylphosphonate 5-triphosphate synthase subunit PhnG